MMTQSPLEVTITQVHVSCVAPALCVQEVHEAALLWLCALPDPSVWGSKRAKASSVTLAAILPLLFCFQTFGFA